MANIQKDISQLGDGIKAEAKDTSLKANQVAQKINNAVSTHKVGPQKTLDHIRTYPLVQETRSKLHRIVLSRVIIGKTKPMVKYVYESKPVQFFRPVLEMLDNTADSTLTLTEKVIPSLKTKTYKRLEEEFMMPCNFVKTRSNNLITKTSAMTKKNIYRPAHAEILKMRKYRNDKYVNNDNKPLIRGVVDPVALPLNDAFERQTRQWLPNGMKFHPNHYCCELDRSMVLGAEFTSNATRAMMCKMWALFLAPFKYGLHANDVMGASLDREPDMSFKHMFVAARRATSHLTKEAAEKLKPASRRRRAVVTV